VDIFAGPGGLSEGFSSVAGSRGQAVFDVVLSIEMDVHAYETLKLRTFFRQFNGRVPNNFYRCLRGEISTAELYELHPQQAEEADSRAWHTELGSDDTPVRTVRARIDAAVGNDDNWVLIGGPPCQAYSIAGRSRNQGKPDYDPDEDKRQRLYVEYLQILGDHRPAVFIMENVKGLLSATLDDERIFHRILEDLRSPTAALRREGRNVRRGHTHRYRIYSLVERRMFENGDLQGSVICAERYGVPQARHRVILLGLRDDLDGVIPDVLHVQEVVPVYRVLAHMPAVRSGLSRRADSPAAWMECLRSQIGSRWVNAGARRVADADLSRLLRTTLTSVTPPALGRGGEFVPGDFPVDYKPEWFLDNRIGGLCNYSTRSHMERDIHRYLYAACYAQHYGRSPNLKQFPTDLLPNHVSTAFAVSDGGHFCDRFRVQVANRPSTTVMSHISKDGHYYIHFDPGQCRSLTVREAARLQTFPDNYFFCGPRTAQYVQVGNAVPPLLAKQIGEVVLDVLQQAGMVD